MDEQVDQAAAEYIVAYAQAVQPGIWASRLLLHVVVGYVLLGPPSREVPTLRLPAAVLQLLRAVRGLRALEITAECTVRFMAGATRAMRVEVADPSSLIASLAQRCAASLTLLRLQGVAATVALAGALQQLPSLRTLLTDWQLVLRQEAVVCELARSVPQLEDLAASLFWLEPDPVVAAVAAFGSPPPLPSAAAQAPASPRFAQLHTLRRPLVMASREAAAALRRGGAPPWDSSGTEHACCWAEPERLQGSSVEALALLPALRRLDECPVDLRMMEVEGDRAVDCTACVQLAACRGSWQPAFVFMVAAPTGAMHLPALANVQRAVLQVWGANFAGPEGLELWWQGLDSACATVLAAMPNLEHLALKFGVMSADSACLQRFALAAARHLPACTHTLVVQVVLDYQLRGPDKDSEVVQAVAEAAPALQRVHVKGLRRSVLHAAACGGIRTADGRHVDVRILDAPELGQEALDER